ncbi:uroporphyrinogen-III synthase [Erythrobacter sp. SDW2]|uniref:uroporphyrinogen-III synthase n=1 Tax=Erythrobacter sp. SDW2 TaxID=2907154 RepID=UPI001F40E2E6|nr:uroporphyrinogen-III synthase [Erythrobacter sp. SDW2]UIP07873.1 uroporphyrinogen-III synthase [Erythrobacter sp. SDW2]
MSKAVYVLRPEPGLTSTLVGAFGHGIPARGMPLAKVEPVAWKAPAEPFDAILISSANAIRHGGKELDKVRHLPVLAVGGATAQAAREAGFRVDCVGEGGLQRLLDSLDDAPRRLLRLAGEAHLPVDSPASTTTVTVIAYAAHFLSLTPAQGELLEQGGVAMLHSGEMARHFAEQCEWLGIDKVKIALAVLAPRIAEMAGGGWNSVHIAPARSDAALLEMVAGLCQKQHW